MPEYQYFKSGFVTGFVVTICGLFFMQKKSRVAPPGDARPYA